MTRQSGGIGAAALLLVLTLAVVATSAVTLVQTSEGHISSDAFAAAIGQCGVCFAVLLGGPMLLGLVGALIAGVSGQPPAATAAARETPVEPAEPAPPSTDAALRLLALLQQEGRLVDFLLEDIGAYDDSQIGAAVRSIHAGCRAVLDERVRLERILEGEDGASVEVPAGFDAGAIRVTGNVAGAPPFRGTLQHSGWRVEKITLPESSTDPRIVAPAEVEVP
jgi:hypothetical protein